MAVARRDAQLARERDPQLQSERGKAMRELLWLMERDRAIKLLRVG